MKKQFRATYHCDHCRAHRLTAKAAERHERFCKNNPNNKHKCFGCQNLKVVAGTGPDGRSCKQFTCEAFERRMYSYVAQKRGLGVGALGVDVMRMPLQCAAYAAEVSPYQEEPSF